MESLLVKNTLCGEWENQIEVRASGNNVMRNRVMRGLGVIEIDNLNKISILVAKCRVPPSIFGRSRAERPRSQSKGGGHQGIFQSQKPQYVYISGQ